MNILVTGGAGFIGSHVAESLVNAGHEVSIIDNFSSGKKENLEEIKTAAVVDADITDNDVVATIKDITPDVICHLAAQPSVSVSVAQPPFDANSNIIGSLNVLEGARHAGTQKVVYAASGGTLYGELSRDQLPATEDLPRRPLSHYGVSKAAVIDYLVLYEHLYRINYTALALANVYGPRQDPHGEAGVIAIFSERLVADSDCVIFGDGEQTRDFVYASDVADAFLKATQPIANGEIINIGTSSEISVNNVYSKLAALAGVDKPAIHADPRPGDIMFSSISARKAETLLDFRPETSLDEGLRATYEWFATRADKRG